MGDQLLSRMTRIVQSIACFAIAVFMIYHCQAGTDPLATGITQPLLMVLASLSFIVTGIAIAFGPVSPEEA